MAAPQTTIYLRENVLEAALARIRRLYNAFPQVLVDFSGGKDSTVTLNLTLQVAEEMGRLPVPVLFLDQEAEWEAAITYIRAVMQDPRVQPYWFQGPFRLFNAASRSTPWLDCWKEGAQWLRAKELDSIHDNRTGVDRFKELFAAVGKTYFGQAPLAHLAGVRCEESPTRRLGLTSHATFQDITWGNIQSKALGHYTFYPLYDWSYRDIWKAIHDHEWPYCTLYDAFYQYGVPLQEMRVSSVHHETAALHWLPILQEIEPHTWEQIVGRVSDVNAVSQAQLTYHIPATLPRMFASWREYRDYLLDHLVTDAATQAIFRKQFVRWDVFFAPELEEKVMRFGIQALLVNDYHLTKFGNFYSQYRRESRDYKQRRADAVTAGAPL